MTGTRTTNLSPAKQTWLLLAGFGVALLLRVVIGGLGVAQSVLAGLAFAASLAAMAAAAGTRLSFSWRVLGLGVLGGLALCVPAVIRVAVQGSSGPTAHGYFAWGLVVSLVAVAEEYFFRGALYDAAHRWLGAWPAVLVAAIAFAALHVPLYGWHVLPLDLAVGVWLGALRVTTNSPTAPAAAHTVADLAAWWLR
jgi:membrane protease YdiL (CAAX protease family)